MRRCSLEKLGRPSSPSATISPSMTQVVIPKNFPMSASSGNETVTSRSFRLWARTRPPSTNSTARTPSHLISNAQFSLSVGRFPATASMGLIDIGQWIGAGRRTVPVDHPVAILRLEQHEASGGPRPMEHELDLGIGPFLDVVVTRVPDRHTAAPVFALRDLALEGRILKGMILGVHGEMVLFRRLGKTLGESPRDEHTLSLEPEVPVETARRGVPGSRISVRNGRFCDRTPIGSGVFWGSRLVR